MFDLVEPRYDRSYAHARAELGEDLTTLLAVEKQFIERDDIIRDADEKRRFLAEWQRLLELNTDPEATFYLNSRKQLTQYEVQYWDNQWVTLDFDRDLDHWTGTLQPFTVEDGNQITLKTKESLSSYLQHRGSFPGPKELKLEMVAQEASQGEGKQFSVVWATLANAQAAAGNFDQALASIARAEKINNAPVVHAARLLRIRNAIDRKTFDQVDVSARSSSTIP